MNLKQLTDLGLIAAFITLGYQPLERQINEKKQVVFVFETDEYFDGLRNDYLNGRLEVNAQAYYQNLKSIKANIYQLLKGEDAQA